MVLKRTFVVGLQGVVCCLSTLSTDAAGQLDVLGHDGHTLGVDGAQVGILEKSNQVSLRGLLQSHDGRALETQIGLEVLGDLTDQALEWQLADEQLSALLVTTDLTESHGTGPVTMGLLDTTSGWGALASGLGSQLFPRGLATGRFASGLLGTSHVFTLRSRVNECPNRLSRPLVAFKLSRRSHLIGQLKRALIGQLAPSSHALQPWLTRRGILAILLI